MLLDSEALRSSPAEALRADLDGDKDEDKEEEETVMLLLLLLLLLLCVRKALRRSRCAAGAGDTPADVGAVAPSRLPASSPASGVAFAVAS